MRLSGRAIKYILWTAVILLAAIYVGFESIVSDYLLLVGGISAALLGFKVI